MSKKITKKDIKLVTDASFRLAKLCHECQSLDGGLWERACKLMGDLNRFANQAKRA